jgi:Putative prokaryotic signal transducing protein
MKLVFTSIDLVAVSELKALLDNAGIACFLNNEVSSTLAGGIPMAEAMPELWIEDDSRLEEALQIKKDWQSPNIQGSPWTCPKCGEKQEPQFTSCWKCGTQRP